MSYKFMALILSIMTALGLVMTPKTDSPVTQDEEAKLSFVFWGDTQVSNIFYERGPRFSAACRDLENINGKLDALLIVGDIAENGMESEYQTIYDMLSPAADKFDHILMCPGNHDVRLKAYKLQMKRFTAFNNSFPNAVQLDGKRYNYTYEINGYKFIVMGTDSSTFEEAYISDEQLEWLDSEIAATQDSGKPVFVMNHQPLKKTHGLPGTWGMPEAFDLGSVGEQSEEIEAIFNKYNNVIYLTGHLHNGVGKYSYQDCGSFKALNVPTVSCNNADGLEDNGQGYVVNVYEDKIVAKGRVFAAGEWIDPSVDNAVIEIPLDYLK